MQLKLNVFVAAVAISLPAAAAAQMSGQSYGQQPPPSATEPAQSPPSATGLSRQSPPPAETTQVKPATAAEIKAGADVYDPQGGSVGKIESVAADGVVVSTGTVKAKVPASSLGHGDKGLVIAMTKTEFEAAAKKAPK